MDKRMMQSWETIKLLSEGIPIQYRYPACDYNPWHDCDPSHGFYAGEDTQYRVKPGTLENKGWYCIRYLVNPGKSKEHITMGQYQKNEDGFLYTVESGEIKSIPRTACRWVSGQKIDPTIESAEVSS